MNTNKIALVTGASSGIGLACVKRLCENGFTVVGLARDFTKTDYTHPLFEKIIFNLSQLQDIETLKKQIDAKHIHVLINNAGFGYFAPHEEVPTQSIIDMININTTAPILLSKLFLRELKKNRGFIFNINSISGIKSAPFGAVYGASKSALRHFGKSIFEEGRKQGLKVINISPDITKTNFFDTLNFSNEEDMLSYIKPEEIAEVIIESLNRRDGIVVTDMVIEPQIFKIKKKKRLQ